MSRPIDEPFERELLWDPCLDVVGQRLPNVFVRRGDGDGASEIAAVRAPAADLGVGERGTDVPRTPAERLAWLDAPWRRMDEWTARRGPLRVAGGRPAAVSV